MLKYFFAIVTLLCSSVLPAQAPQLGAVIEKEFGVTDVPEKWKTESAVILGQKQEYLFSRLSSGKSFTTNVRINEYVHKRIKLQDKNALENFLLFIM